MAHDPLYGHGNYIIVNGQKVCKKCHDLSGGENYHARPDNSTRHTIKQDQKTVNELFNTLCQYLPNGYRIVVEAKKGAATITLHNDKNGSSQDLPTFPDDKDPVSDACKRALSLCIQLP